MFVLLLLVDGFILVGAVVGHSDCEVTAPGLTSTLRSGRTHKQVHTQSLTIKHHNQTTSHARVTPQRQAKRTCNSVLCGHESSWPQGIFYCYMVVILHFSASFVPGAHLHKVQIRATDRILTLYNLYVSRRSRGHVTSMSRHKALTSSSLWFFLAILPCCWRYRHMGNTHGNTSFQLHCLNFTTGIYNWCILLVYTFVVIRIMEFEFESLFCTWLDLNKLTWAEREKSFINSFIMVV